MSFAIGPANVGFLPMQQLLARAAAGGATEAAGGGGSGDAFALSNGLSPAMAAFMSPQSAMQLNPAAFLSQLASLGAGRDLGELGNDSSQGLMTPGTWGSSSAMGVTDANRSEVTQAVKQLFAQLNRDGLALEARPGSKLAEAMANGDFSELTNNEMGALLVALVMFGSNRKNADQVASQGAMPFAQRGSWKPSGGNRAGGGTQRTGANANASAPTGPAPTGDAPSTSGPAGSRVGDAAAATARRMGSTGLCYRGVKVAVRAAGVELTGGSAYQAAGQLAARPDKFDEVSVSPSQLKDLPKGAVVVWGKTGRSPHGHISVALGDGREASDHIQNQMTSLRGATNYRVFIPKD